MLEEAKPWFRLLVLIYQIRILVGGVIAMRKDWVGPPAGLQIPMA